MTRHPRRAPNYDRKLTRRITLEDGTKLATLRDAANLFAERFATVTSWRVLEIAIERLIAAAESAERDKVKAAADAIERVLRARRLVTRDRAAWRHGTGSLSLARSSSVAD